MTTPAIILAAPASGAGKTVLSLGLMRALRHRGLTVRAAKSGPDYIDPAFHAAATGAPSVNLDAWAMDPDSLRARAAAQGGDILVIEGAMGVLDGAVSGHGSVADLAIALGAPVVLILDIARSGTSAVLAPAGLKSLRPDVPLAGAILNRAGSERHAGLAAEALRLADITSFGALPRDPALALPERHLGLVQASETDGLEVYLDTAAGLVEAHLDVDGLLAATRPIRGAAHDARSLPPLGQRIALARDRAFAFAYPHLLADWRSAGVEMLPFSPLADEPPDPRADAIFLPGGYPELHAGSLALADTFRAAMQSAAHMGTRIYGECGGYMVLGEALTDAGGTGHPMLGLLPHATSFQVPALTLGYRILTSLRGAPWDRPLAGHEFHYATIQADAGGNRLFRATDAAGNSVEPMGQVRGSVSGSFAHVIGPAAAS